MVKVIVLILAGALVAGCQSVQTTQPGVVGVQRSQNMLVSSGTVNSSAAKAYQKVIAEAQQKGQLNRDAAQVARIRGIACAQLAPHCRTHLARLGFQQLCAINCICT